MAEHWSFVCDSITENFKNDLSWLITLKAVKVCDSLCNWGYINSNVCATCPCRETIDHCFLNCACVKAVWAFFVPLLSGPSASLFQTVCLYFSFASRLTLLGNVQLLFFFLRLFCMAFRNSGTRRLSIMTRNLHVPLLGSSPRISPIVLNWIIFVSLLRSLGLVGCTMASVWSWVTID